ncbi:hypothetical protein [Sulfurovum sp.]|uniref:hypothetical protein n=1 Tax=Sulfurovum sp. TaxID=1969726 RepID=UPI003567B1D8
MSNRTEVSREVLNNFLERWSIDRVELMTLEEYVSVGNKDTFCQWLETKTRSLGSIKGINSSKFGIYKRSNKNKKPKNLVSDSEYSWQRYYGQTKSEAFENIKKEILYIIKFSQKGQFEKLDNLHLTLFVKWKIAYLYSNERLIPIFKKSVLHTIAQSFKLKVDKKTKNSEIQYLIIDNKPAHVSIYDYAHELYTKYGDSALTGKPSSSKRKKRKAAESRNSQSQQRRGGRSYIATQNHNLIQEKLKLILEKEHGVGKVLLEENYVDVKVVLPKKLLFYEVKSSAYASDCVREALGQILSYSYHDDDKRKKFLFVAGQYEPNNDEIGYINYVKDMLSIDFEYISIALD